jgi:hypothetical protein
LFSSSDDKTWTARQNIDMKFTIRIAKFDTSGDLKWAVQVGGPNYDSMFGLSAAVFTQDLTRALQAIDCVDVGVLHINSESAGADPHVPFGGAKRSGLGPKEQGGAAREFFTHTTTVYVRGGTPNT